jgi:glutamate-ammonia-ligase adenylyltransferase
MTSFAFLKEVKRQIQPHNEDWARSGMSDFRTAAEAAGEVSFLKNLEASRRALDVLAALFGNSPYLRRLAVRDPLSVKLFLETPTSQSFEGVLEDLKTGFAGAIDQAEAMRVLRKAKARAALLIAMADITGAWSLEDVTGALSRFADVCLDMSLRFLLRAQAAKGKYILPDTEAPEQTCGITIIAMGKYGAFELNYSSDIDVVVFFDPEKVPVAPGADVQKIAIRMTRDLVTLMQEATGDGYVFRTDLRLRPDAGATQVALSIDAASFYYETMGQNWERAAWIKARAAAGDKQVGNDFLKSLEPFIWRRYLDYAAIEDIHSIKRQIHAHKGHAVIAIEGHNIKLGRGGIREIEFFAQTQQLIGGGRDASLKVNTTVGALNALVDVEVVQPGTRDDLVEAYRFLREVEHRLQMVHDEQTHTMPREAGEVDAIACFCGFDDATAFRKTLRRHHLAVQNHYAELFEEEESLGSVHGNLVFTGVEDDPGTMETLEGMGFKRPSRAAEAIRSWHHGRIRVTRSERSRALLTKLIPRLLEAFSQTSDPDAAMANFDRFIQGLPAGVQLFSMLQSRPEMMDLLANILGTAPKLAKTLAKTSSVLDALLDPDFFGEFPGASALQDSFAKALQEATSFEEKLDEARIWSSEMKFRAGVNVLTGHVEAGHLGSFFADAVDAVIGGLQPVAVAEVARRAGKIDGDFAVIAFGKLGSREMSAESDLDIIFVYDTPDADTGSSGAKPLHNSQYFARVSQRLISALSAPTSEGQMFEIDARLRPSGNKGPIAIRYEGFDRYQREEAWTWEKMALTRARVVTGSPALTGKIEATIKAVLTAPRDKVSVLADVVEMRARIFEENGSDNPWDLKHVRGGLVDVEFIAQGLQLAHAPDNPEILAHNTSDALRNLGDAGLLDPDTTEQLVKAADLLHSLTQITRVCVEGPLDPAEASENLKSLVARSIGAKDFGSAETMLKTCQENVRKIFERFIGQGPGNQQ